jgi:hypothetical protein
MFIDVIFLLFLLTRETNVFQFGRLFFFTLLSTAPAHKRVVSPSEKYSTTRRLTSVSDKAPPHLQDICIEQKNPPVSRFAEKSGLHTMTSNNPVVFDITIGELMGMYRSGAACRCR